MRGEPYQPTQGTWGDDTGRSARPPQRTIPRRLRYNVLLSLPIATQLTIGFLVAALIAALSAGISGTQSTQSLSKQSEFYQSLLGANINLTTGANYLQLMDTRLHQTLLDAAVQTPSQETLSTDKNSLADLANRYDAILAAYGQQSLVDQHPDQIELLREGNHPNQPSQQHVLASSAQRTWTTYSNAQTQVIALISNGDIAGADALERTQGEPTNADSISALKALIQFNNRLASSVRDAASVEEQARFITSIVAAALAFIGIVLVGWFISNSIVRRLVELRQLTIAVEEGRFDARVPIIGRDELAQVSASVNGMLDTIVGLLEETRRQRDALTHAADRLFADMRVAGAGDLRVNASVGSDPIGVLGNAFNLTIGRFRRFILRTQTSVEQLDVLAQRETRRASAFLGMLRQTQLGAPTTGGSLTPPQLIQPSDSGEQVFQQARRARDLIYGALGESTHGHVRMVLDLAEESYVSASRLYQLVVALGEARSPGTVSHLAQMQRQEMATLEQALQRLGREAFMSQQNMSSGLGELNTVVEQIAIVARSGPASRPASMNAAASNVYSPTEMLQSTNAFAREIGEISQELMSIVQDIHASLTPFSIDQRDELLFAGQPMRYAQE